jgi:hypothetical protein
MLPRSAREYRCTESRRHLWRTGAEDLGDGQEGLIPQKK